VAAEALTTRDRYTKDTKEAQIIMDNEVMECPFCGWKAQAGEYEMMLVSLTGSFPFRDVLSEQVSV
jgi:hypothetical protein